MASENEKTAAAQQAAEIASPRNHTLTGDVRMHRAFHSEFLHNDRDVIVWLPPDYASDRQRRFSVLYLHDGQNLFDGATSFVPGREWQVDETAQRLVLAREIESLIIVGIYNTGEHRLDEYTPVPNPANGKGGKADLYGRMLVEELIPFIDLQYRTVIDRQHTVLGGSSLGGLLTLHLGLKYPQVFSRLLVMSPSVWWGNRVILETVNSLSGFTAQHLWLDCGTKEGERTIENTRALRDALLSKGWKLNGTLHYLEARGAIHDEAAWGARMEPALKFLFPPRPEA